VALLVEFLVTGPGVLPRNGHVPSRFGLLLRLTREGASLKKSQVGACVGVPVSDALPVCH
jgi:hypothetical protein